MTTKKEIPIAEAMKLPSMIYSMAETIPNYSLAVLRENRPWVVRAISIFRQVVGDDRDRRMILSAGLFGVSVPSFNALPVNKLIAFCRIHEQNPGLFERWAKAFCQHGEVFINLERAVGEGDTEEILKWAQRACDVGAYLGTLEEYIEEHYQPEEEGPPYGN